MWDNMGCYCYTMPLFDSLQPLGMYAHSVTLDIVNIKTYAKWMDLLFFLQNITFMTYVLIFRQNIRWGYGNIPIIGKTESNPGQYFVIFCLGTCPVVRVVILV